MRTRLQNAKNYALKGALCCSPCSVIGAGASIGIYYWIKYLNYSIGKLSELADENGCGWGSDGAICRGDRDWVTLQDTINRESDAYGTQQAEADLATMWPVIAGPWMCAGMVVGGLYGFLQPVNQDEQAQSLVGQFQDLEPASGNHFIANDIKIDIEEEVLKVIEENPAYPSEFLDPVHLGTMSDPQQLTCGHNVDNSTLKSLQFFSQSKNEACRCPLCRAEITDKNTQPNSALKTTINNYLAPLKPAPKIDEKKVELPPLGSGTAVSGLGMFAQDTPLPSSAALITSNRLEGP